MERTLDGQIRAVERARLEHDDKDAICDCMVLSSLL
jgi:hypothetical protein